MYTWDPERESKKEGKKDGERRLLVHIILASVYRSEAWANQTDIIDLTCDLEIRKIADGEGLEPIIIVNTGRPSPFYLLLPPPSAAAAATAILSLSLSLLQWLDVSRQPAIRSTSLNSHLLFLTYIHTKKVAVVAVRPCAPSCVLRGIPVLFILVFLSPRSRRNFFVVPLIHLLLLPPPSSPRGCMFAVFQPRPSFAFGHLWAFFIDPSYQEPSLFRAFIYINFRGLFCCFPMVSGPR